MERKERPIIFQAESVKAILEGRKTQTRRIVKNVPENVVLFHELNRAYGGRSEFWDLTIAENNDLSSKRIKCPYGKVGDHLWVREMWRHKHWGGLLPTEGFGNQIVVEYVADDDHPRKYERSFRACRKDYFLAEKKYATPQWTKKSSIFMPRWASRLTLEITNIRVEKLNDISGGDVWREGVGKQFQGDCDLDYEFWASSQKTAFAEAWNQINPKNPWLSDPWVFVIEFKSNGR